MAMVTEELMALLMLGSEGRHKSTKTSRKSVLTDDNDTYDESRATHSTAQWTLATGTKTETEAESENDWLGYMRHILFPKDVSSFSMLL